jgi:hypothetical protein
MCVHITAAKSSGFIIQISELSLACFLLGLNLNLNLPLKTKRLSEITVELCENEQRTFEGST